MALDSLRCDHGTAEALLVNQAQLVMCCPQMVDDSSFVLPFLTTPQAMGYPIEMMECIGVVDAS